MNNFQGHILEIKSSGNISMVSVMVANKFQLISVVIDTPKTANYLSEGNPINVLFKETEVIICTVNTLNISIENRFPGVISDLERGILLSRLVLDTDLGPVVAVISTQSVNELELIVNMKVMIMVKMNEIILGP